MDWGNITFYGVLAAFWCAAVVATFLPAVSRRRYLAVTLRWILWIPIALLVASRIMHAKILSFWTLSYAIGFEALFLYFCRGLKRSVRDWTQQRGAPRKNDSPTRRNRGH